MHKLIFSLLFIGVFLNIPFKTSAQVTVTDQLYFALTSNLDGSFDRFYLNFADSYSDDYAAMEDALKMTTFYPSKPAVWTIQEETGQALVVNGLQMIDNRTVRVGFSVPKDGDYTISMSILERTDLRSIVLVDSVTGVKTDLLKNPSYSFNSDSVQNVLNRFTLLINYVDILPMLVSGDVLISGPMRSDGAVHVLSGAEAGRIDIDNTDANTKLMADTIILYSDDTSDGLLRNLNTSGGGVKGITTAAQPGKVIVRKKFAPGVYTYFSLPFSVTPDSVFAGNSSVPLIGLTDYWAYGFDPQVRAENKGYLNPAVWKEIDYTTGGFGKAMGYQFWYDKGGMVDFVTTNPATVQNLFTLASKDVTYTMWRITNPNSSQQEEYDAGWAFIGGLNTTTFALNNGTNIGGSPVTAIYYRIANNSQSTNDANHITSYSEVIIGGGVSEAANVGPYTPFYIQGSISAPGSANATFTYKPSGLVFDAVTFRSSKDETVPKDQLYFALASDKDSSFDRFYLNFDDSYSEEYVTMEDAVKMSTFYENKPALWILHDETEQALVVNGLPMKEGREVRVGFSIPEAGDYTISLKALRQQDDVRSVILVDSVTGRKIDLLQTSYAFNTEAVDGENERFALYINSSLTDIPTVKNNAVYAYVKNNLLTVKNLSEGDNVQVLDLSGSTIASGKASGKEFTVTLKQKGVYIVQVKGEKESVLKVLN